MVSSTEFPAGMHAFIIRIDSPPLKSYEESKKTGKLVALRLKSAAPWRDACTCRKTQQAKC
jgi:hypothetical protein